MAKKKASEASGTAVTKHCKQVDPLDPTPGNEDSGFQVPTTNRPITESPSHERVERHTRTNDSSTVQTAEVSTPSGEVVEIQIDSEFLEILPHQTPLELEQLDANIERDRRCLEPLIVWREQRMLLDGHSRMPILQKYDVAVEIEWIDLPDRNAAREWIINHQLGRRNLTKQQASYLRGLRYNAEKNGHGGDRRSNGSSGHSDHLKTADKLADQYAVSPETIRRDGAFARDVDTIARNCGSEARAAILSKEVKIAETEVKELAALDADKQLAALEQRLAHPKQKSSGRPANRQQTKSITIPAEPKAGAAALLDKLGTKVAGELHEALGSLLKKTRES